MLGGTNFALVVVNHHAAIGVEFTAHVLAHGHRSKLLASVVLKTILAGNICALLEMILTPCRDAT